MYIVCLSTESSDAVLGTDGNINHVQANVFAFLAVPDC